MPLKDNFNSNYFESRNALNKRHDGYIEVFVENETDVPFWSALLTDCGLRVEVRPASKTNLTRGKQVVLKYAEGAGEFLLLCVDSDYDYLLDGATAQSKTIKENPYIFQTYTYSIENYKCFAETLHQVVVDATSIDNKDLFDYEGFMKRYSQTVYELFVYSFYFEAKNQQENAIEHPFSIEAFCKHIKLRTEVDLFDKSAKTLEALEAKVRSALNELPQIENENLAPIKENLARLGVVPENTYLFVKGHVIFDKVVLMFLRPIFNHLKKAKIDEIRHMDGSEIAKREKIKAYKYESIGIDLILKAHTHYKSCPMMQKIRDDLSRYVKIVNPS